MALDAGIRAPSTARPVCPLLDSTRTGLIRGLERTVSMLHSVLIC